MIAQITEEEEARYAELQSMALDFARKGDATLLEPMIESGLPVDFSDEKGQSLLMLASYNGRLGTVAMLLRKGAEIDRRNDRGQTPLGGVAFKGHLEVAELLVQSGADVNADNGNGMTALSYASMFGRKDVVKFLKKNGGTMSFKDKLMGIPGALLNRKAS